MFAACQPTSSGTESKRPSRVAPGRAGGAAILVNPHDVEGVAEALLVAHNMPFEQRAARMRAMRRSIRRDDVFAWVEGFMRAASIAAPPARPGATREGRFDSVPELVG